jgi:hypothetical protein
MPSVLPWMCCVLIAVVVLVVWYLLLDCKGFPPVISAAQKAVNAADEALYYASPDALHPAHVGGAIKAGPTEPIKTEGFMKYFEYEFDIKVAALPPRVYRLKENHYYNRPGSGVQGKHQYTKDFSRPESGAEQMTTADIFKLLGRHPTMETVMKLVPKNRYVV